MDERHVGMLHRFRITLLPVLNHIFVDVVLNKFTFDQERIDSDPGTSDTIDRQRKRHQRWSYANAPTLAHHRLSHRCEGRPSTVVEEDSLAWKHVRVRRLHFVMAVCYLETGVRLGGENLARVMKLGALTDGGRCPILCIGDFNVPPEV